MKNTIINTVSILFYVVITFLTVKSGLTGGIDFNIMVLNAFVIIPMLSLLLNLALNKVVR